MKRLASTAVFVVIVMTACRGATGQNLRIDPPGWETPTGGSGAYDPDPFDFGNVPVGDTATMTFQLVSVGPTPLYISSVSLEENPDGVFAVTHVDEIPPELMVDEWVDVVVTYTPAGLGDHQATLRVTSNDREEPNLDGPLTGTGVPEPTTMGLLAIGALAMLKRRRNP